MGGRSYIADQSLHLFLRNERSGRAESESSGADAAAKATIVQ